MMNPATQIVLEPPAAKTAAPRRRRGNAATSMMAQGESMVWLSGVALAIALLMIVGLLALVLWQGTGTFWPAPLVLVNMSDGRVLLGEVTRSEWYRPNAATSESSEPAPEAQAADQAVAEVPPADATPAAPTADDIQHRRLLRTGNFDLTGVHFTWIRDRDVAEESTPEWATIVERLEWGRFYGTPAQFLVDGEVVASEPAAIWKLFEEHHDLARSKWHERRDLEQHDIGAVNRRLEDARLAVREAELDEGAGSTAHEQAVAANEKVQQTSNVEFERIREAIQELQDEYDRYEIQFTTADGGEKAIKLAEIVRAYQANRLGLAGKLGVYLSRWGEFLSDDPREANSEGGVFPAIWGTVAMTLIMSLAVVPFGVLAALYLHEYARAGLITSAVRISVNNLAGVPSIVFGVFGLGFFCYILGASIDQLLFEAALPNPTYGKGGLVWASLTLALLTLPVVIVATEEALSAVPNSIRDASYACGASKWQTIRRVVLPRGMPGIMTGMILAMARGAGEVAPLMLVGAVKLAPELPIDLVPPFVHGDRSFMHLGFHIYDLGFQSQNSEAAKPMVYTTTLLLIAIIGMLNISAVMLRNRLRRRFIAIKF